MTRFSYGGYFNYEQYNIYRTVSELKNIIEYNNGNYHDLILKHFKYVSKEIEDAADLLNAVDYFISKDISETEFIEKIDKIRERK